MQDRSDIKVSLPTIRRLPRYLQVLKQCNHEQCEFISSTRIATELGFESIQVRKDIEVLGIKGQPRIGYKMSELVSAIECFLSWDNDNEAFIVGVGHLGSALMGYKGFEDYGLKIIAGFDANEELVGSTIHGTEIFGMEKLVELTARLKIHIGVLAVPEAAAQDVAELMIAGGIVGIWNFTPVRLAVPEDIIVERVDLASSLAVLSRKTSRQLKTRIFNLGK